MFRQQVHLSLGEVGAGRIKAVVHGDLQTILVSVQLLPQIGQGVVHAGGIVDETANRARLDEPGDGALQLVGGRQFRGFVADEIHRDIIRPQTVERAAKQQSHDRHDQAEAEHQLVANPPVRGHTRSPWAASVLPVSRRPPSSPQPYPCKGWPVANGRTLPKGPR